MYAFYISVSERIAVNRAKTISFVILMLDECLHYLGHISLYFYWFTIERVNIKSIELQKSFSP